MAFLWFLLFVFSVFSLGFWVVSCNVPFARVNVATCEKYIFVIRSISYTVWRILHRACCSAREYKFTLGSTGCLCGEYNLYCMGSTSCSKCEYAIHGTMSMLSRGVHVYYFNEYKNYYSWEYMLRPKKFVEIYQNRF